MKKEKFLLLFILLFIISGSLYSQVTNKRIKFRKGESFATIENGIARGEEHSYLIGAKRNQFMTVEVTSLENNAVIQIWSEETGAYLPGTEEGQDAKKWEGILPTTGDYKIVVGSTRGGAEYTLSVFIE